MKGTKKIARKIYAKFDRPVVMPEARGAFMTRVGWATKRDFRLQIFADSISPAVLIVNS